MDLVCTCINTFPIHLPKPPEQILYKATQKWFKPVAFRIPKEGEYSWNLECTQNSSPFRPILTYNFCDGIIPEWIYEEIK